MRLSITVETADPDLVHHMFNDPCGSSDRERKLAEGLVVRNAGGPDRCEPGMPNPVMLTAEIRDLSLVPVLSSWLCEALGNEVASLVIGKAVVLNVEEDVTLALLAELASAVEITT